VRQIFLKVILSHGEAPKKHLPDYASEVVSLSLIAQNLVKSWEKVKADFKVTKTLKDKNLWIEMMYQT